VTKIRENRYGQGAVKMGGRLGHSKGKTDEKNAKTEGRSRGLGDVRKREGRNETQKGRPNALLAK